MNDKSCKTCLYEELCGSENVCEHYTPTDDEMTDSELDEYINRKRREHRNEWWKYIDEDSE